MPKFVSLFRAINVGGNNMVKMSVLKELHEALGFSNVLTYLQTGNVIFESERTEAIQLAEEIAGEFKLKVGFSVAVLVRTATEIRALALQNPFLKQPEQEAKWQVVMFLSASPTSEARNDLLASYHGPEELVFADQELFIYFPTGQGRSKLSNSLLEKKLKVVGTGRNWLTVTKLSELTQI